MPNPLPKISPRSARIKALLLMVIIALYALPAWGQTSVPDALGIPTDPNAERAEVLVLSEPYDDYFRIIQSLDISGKQYSELLSALASAVAANGQERQAWQLTQRIADNIYLAMARINIATVYLNSGERGLAENALNVAWQDLALSAKNQTAEERELENATIARAVGLTINAFGPDALIKQVDKNHNPVVSSLMVAHFVRMLGGDNALILANKEVPLALLDLTFSQLDRTAGSERFIDGALTLASRMTEYGESGNDRARDLALSALELLKTKPELVTPERQTKLATILAVTGSSDDIEAIIEATDDPAQKAGLIISIADQLSMPEGYDTGSRMLQNAQTIIESAQIADETVKEELRKMLISALTRIGRHQDAYSIVLQPTDDAEITTNRAYLMAYALINDKKDKLIGPLWDQIPHTELRGELLLKAAENAFEDGRDEEALINVAKIFETPTTPKYKDGFFTQVIRLAETHMQETDKEALYRKLYDELQRIEPPIAKYMTELELLEFEKQQSTKKANEATQRVNKISTEIWPYKTQANFNELAARIVSFLARAGKLEVALTQAASIPQSPLDDEATASRARAFSAVIEETLTRGDLNLAELTLSAIDDNEQKRIIMLELLKAKSDTLSQTIN